MFFGNNNQSCHSSTIWNPFLPIHQEIVESMSTLFQDRLNHSRSDITVKVTQRLQKRRFIWHERHGFAFFSRNSEHYFGSNVGNELGVMLKGKGLHRPNFVYDIFRINCIMTYKELIEYNIVGEGKYPLLCCFSFISKLDAGGILTTGQYMNYPIFSSLQCRQLLENSFHSIHNDKRNTSGEKIPFVSVGILRLVLMFRKASNNHFYRKRSLRLVALRQVEVSFYRATSQNCEAEFDAFVRVFWETCKSIHA